MNLDINNISRDFLASIPMSVILPQQKPFVMVDGIVELNELTTLTKFEITADNIFCEAGCFSASGMIENIAQTCAARIGFINKYIYGKEVQIGFIGAVRDYQVLGLARVGEVLHTRVEVKEEVFGMTLAAAEVRVGNRLLVTTEIKIALENRE